MADLSMDCGLRSRISQLLRKESHSDVEFLVGTPPGRYRCHKIILAAGSEVFEAMFYGPLGQKSPVRVPDVTSRGFAITLQYLYSDAVCLQDNSEAFEAAYSADKYMIANLFEACQRYLLDHLTLTPENVLSTHEQASLLGMLDLGKRCLCYVSRNAHRVFLSRSYAVASKGTFRDVLSLDLMDIESEREIVEALWTWGKRRCAEDGVRCSAENVRRYTGEFLEHVRFFAMGVEELADALDTCQLLDTSEELALLWNLAMPRGSELKVPCGICTKTKTRSISNSSRVRLPGRYLYDGSMTSFLIDECRMRADISIAGNDSDGSPSITVIGAVIAFKPIPCYSREDRWLEVELTVANSADQFRSRAKCRFEAKEEDGEVRRSLLLEDYVVIGKGQVGSLTATVSGEGVRLMRRTAEDAASCALGDSALRLQFVGQNNAKQQFVPVRELMIV